MLSAIRLSLRYKVLALILVSTLVALLVSAFVLYTYEARQYRQFLIGDASTQGDLLARASAPTLQFDDPQAAAENLGSLASRPEIVAAAVYDIDGQLFATYVRSNERIAIPERAPEAGLQVIGGIVEMGQAIVIAGERLGSLYLRSKHNLAARQKDYLLILAAVTISSLGVAGLLAMYLLRGVTGPVLAVAEVAQDVMERRDFTLRAERTTDDEIGILVDSFNAMLGEVGRMTAALETSNRQLIDETEERRNAVAALRDADRRKDEFLATLAHELRNPLAPMVTALRLMKANPSTDETAQAFGIIERQLAQMVRLVDDLLDASRITHGKLTVQRSVVELAGIVQNGVDTARQIIDQRRHVLVVELPAEPVFVLGDEVRLAQVFANLLTNAAKYTAPEGRLELTARVVGRRLKVTVRDNGIGMSEATLANVFDMFTQGDAIVADNAHAGLGVGLSLARRLVEMHGGTLEARSAGPGLGSTFEVELDITDPPAATLTAPPGESLQSSNGNRHRILLVDDNVDFATSMAMLLEDLGHDVRVAHRADAAIAMALDMRPDVAFLDIGLPDMDGYELAAWLQEEPVTAATVLIALSGWAQDKDRAASGRARFAGHLVKPVRLEIIEKTLAALGMPETAG